MDISVVILNWNAAEDTIRCVRQIEAWERLKAKVWVVDNASQDDSVARIRAACPKTCLIENKTNLGFAGGTNRGISASLALDDRPLLLLNNDAFVREDDVQRLWHTLEYRDKVGFVAPLLFDAENQENLISAGGKNPVLHHQTRIQELNTDAPVQEVDCVAGTVVLVNTQVFHEVGLLDEDYFFSTELADLCERARRKGFVILVETRARAYHNLARSSNLRDTLYTYYIVRNRFIYLNKFYQSVIRMALFTFWSGYTLLLMTRLYLTGQSETARAVWLALKDGWQRRFGGQNERVLA